MVGHVGEEEGPDGDAGGGEGEEGGPDALFRNSYTQLEYHGEVERGGGERKGKGKGGKGEGRTR